MSAIDKLSIQNQEEDFFEPGQGFSDDSEEYSVGLNDHESHSDDSFYHNEEIDLDTAKSDFSRPEDASIDEPIHEHGDAHGDFPDSHEAPYDTQSNNASDLAKKKKNNQIFYAAVGVLTIGFAGFMYMKFMMPASNPSAQFQMPASIQGGDMPASSPPGVLPFIDDPAGGALIPFDVNAPIDSTQLNDPWSEVESFDPNVNQAETEPAVSISSISGSALAEMGATNFISSGEANERFADLGQAIKDQEARLTELTNKVRTMESKLEAVERQASERAASPAPARAATPAPAAPRTTTATRPVTMADYNVYGMRADRIWVRNAKTGQDVNIGIGEMLTGVGRLQSIDMDSGVIRFSNNRQIVVN